MKTFRIYFVLILMLTAIPALAQSPQKPSNLNYFEGQRLYHDGLFLIAENYLTEFLESTEDASLLESAWYFLVKSRAASDSSNIAFFYEQYVARYPLNLRSVELLSEVGHRYYDAAEYTMAVEHFEKALLVNMPEEKAVEIIWWIAESYIAMNKLDEARDTYLKLADEYPKNDWAPKALYARGRLYLQENKYTETTTAFELLRERYPFNPITRRVGTALGESYFQQARYRDAITALRNALPYLEDKESESKAIYLIAESFNFLDELDEAASWYRRFINLNQGADQERVAHYGLGWVFHKQAIYHWSAQSFNRAITTDDDLSRKALYYKAINEKLSGRYDLALKSFESFGSKYRDGFWIEHAYYEWAITAFEVGDHSSAISILLNLIRTGTRLEYPGKVYSLLGEAYFANNEFGRAVDAFDVAEKITDIDPTIKTQARFQRGWVLFRNQAYPEAQVLFQDVYRENPKGNLAGEALFWSSDSWYNMQEYNRAASGFQQFLNEFPNHEFAGAAMYSLGWSYFRLSEYEKAVGPLRMFLESYEPPPIALFPYDVDTRLRLGDSYYALKQYREAIRYYEQASRSDIGGDYALYQIANSYYRSDQSYEAVQSFRRLLRTYPESRLREQSLYNIGYIYFLAGNYSQAIDEFNSLIRLYRGGNWAARAQYNIGDAYYNAGEHALAIKAYQEVLDRYPRSTYIIEAVNGLQYAMLAAGGTDSSSDILEKFIRQNPQAGTADRLRFRQAEFLLRSADYEGAIEAFRNYIRITNSTQLQPEAWYYIADAQRQLGNTDGAVEAYKRIINDHPRSSRAESALLNLGSISHDRMELEQALHYYQNLLNRTRRLSNEATLGIGDVNFAMARYADAEEAYKSVLQIMPNNDAARLGLAKVQLYTNRQNEAEGTLRDLSEKNILEQGAEAQYLIGLLNQQRRRYSEAIQAYSQVIVLYEAFDHWVSLSMLRSSECYRAQGNNTESNRLLNNIIEKYPGADAAEQARQLLRGN